MAADRPGFRFARYELLRELGVGGFGRVWAARDLDLGRELAIKLLQPEVSLREEFVQRFFQEAKAAAAIMHPGIVTVFECGRVEGTKTSADGAAFIAMEIIPGETLAARLRQVRRFSVDRAVAIVRQLAAALGAAHSRGIIHRDLKPDNVFLVPDADVAFGERVKVVDFGIAKLSDPVTGASGPRTQTTMIFGTPPYMSPEQCKSSARVDARSDIYALGCILYELICGRPPFTGDNGEVMAMQQLTPPPPPSSHVPGLAPAIEQAMLRLLAKDPGARPATMDDVRDELGAAAATVTAVVPSSAPQATSPSSDPATAPTLAPATTLGGAAGTAPSSGVATASRQRVAIAAGVLLVASGVAVAIWRLGSNSTAPADPVPHPPPTVDTTATVAVTPDAAAITPPDAPTCARGQLVGPDTKGQCCWPGQAWNGSRCIGVPASCPDGHVKSAANETCELPACPAGQVRPADSEHCCWPGQIWSASGNKCIGRPACPAPLLVIAEEETCRHPCIGTWRGVLSDSSRLVRGAYVGPDGRRHPDQTASEYVVYKIESFSEKRCGTASWAVGTAMTACCLPDPGPLNRCTVSGTAIRATHSDGSQTSMRCEGDKAITDMAGLRGTLTRVVVAPR